MKPTSRNHQTTRLECSGKAVPDVTSTPAPEVHKCRRLTSGPVAALLVIVSMAFAGIGGASAAGATVPSVPAVAPTIIPIARAASAENLQLSNTPDALPTPPANTGQILGVGSQGTGVSTARSSGPVTDGGQQLGVGTTARDSGTVNNLPGATSTGTALTTGLLGQANGSGGSVCPFTGSSASSLREDGDGGGTPTAATPASGTPASTAPDGGIPTPGTPDSGSALETAKSIVSAATCTAAVLGTVVCASAVAAGPVGVVAIAAAGSTCARAVAAAAGCYIMVQHHEPSDDVSTGPGEHAVDRGVLTVTRSRNVDPGPDNETWTLSRSFSLISPFGSFGTHPNTDPGPDNTTKFKGLSAVSPMAARASHPNVDPGPDSTCGTVPKLQAPGQHPGGPHSGNSAS